MVFRGLDPSGRLRTTQERRGVSARVAGTPQVVHLALLVVVPSHAHPLRCALDCRCELYVPRTHPVDPLPLPTGTNSLLLSTHTSKYHSLRQRCNGSSCSSQLRLFSSEGHSVTIGFWPCHQQDRMAHINHLKRYLWRACD